MKIKEIISQHRRDFSAIMVCEHCESEQKLNSGYDDAFYHQNVIPVMKCESCGKTASEDLQIGEFCVLENQNLNTGMNATVKAALTAGAVDILGNTI